MKKDLLPPTVLDATVLSNFASTQAVGVLTSTLPRPSTVPAVEIELSRGLAEGHEFLENALSPLDTKIPVKTPQLRESQPFDLDPGEAEAYLLARSTDGTLVSDDRDARRKAKRNSIPITGSIGVLARAVQNGSITIETADTWLDTWQRKHGYYSPVQSISELLPEE